MSFVDQIMSGKYPQLEKLFHKEFGKVVDEIFGSLNFDELDESEPAKKSDAKKPSDPEGMVSLATYDRVTDLLEDERRRYEVLMRERDVLKMEKATLQAKLDAVRHELST
jgi:hypothetical protein